MNIQTVSQRFRSVWCFMREIFKEMFYSNLWTVWAELYNCMRQCTETSCLCPYEGHRYGDRKLTKTYVIKPLVVFWGLIASIWVLILIQGLFRLQNLSGCHNFNLCYTILGRHFNIVSSKTLQIQPCFITRQKTLSNRTFLKDKSSAVLITKLKSKKGW